MRPDRWNLAVFIGAPIFITAMLAFTATRHEWGLVAVCASLDVTIIIASVLGAYYLGQILATREALDRTEETHEHLLRLRRILDPHHVEGPS